MKKYTLSLTAVAALFTLSLMPSCKKDDNKTSRGDMVVGTWRTAQTGEDANNNGTWDSNEKRDVDSSEMATFTFNAGGTGSLVADAFPLPISTTWSLMNNDADIRVILKNPANQTPVDTISGNIVTLTATDMVIKDNTETPAAFISLRKK